MYRPDRWENPYKRINEASQKYYGGHPFDAVEETAFEAGADAMLKSLINQPNGQGANVLYVGMLDDSSVILHRPHRKGWLVFIPDD